MWTKQDIKIYVQLFKILFKSENIEGCVYSSNCLKKELFCKARIPISIIIATLLLNIYE